MKKRRQADRAGHGTGATLAVARVAADTSYPGIATLLKETILSEGKADSARIDYTYQLVRLPRGAFVGSNLP